MSETQAEIWDCYRPEPAKRDEPIVETPSTAASNSVAAKVRAQESGAVANGRETVLAFLRGRGKFGATDEEILAAGLHGVGPNAVRARRGELVKRGLVRDSGSSRPLKSGNTGTVWVAAD